MAEGRYARVFHSVMTDERFREVWRSNATLGQWVRMLLVADLMWPVPPDMPDKTRAVRALVDVGLVEERPGGRYTIRGLDAMRERYSGAARNANAVRWESARSPARVLRRQDQTLTRPSRGVDTVDNPSSPGLHDGRHGVGCIVCYPPEEGTNGTE